MVARGSRPAMQQMIEAELTRLSCDTRWHTLIERLLENLADVEAPHRDGWAAEHEILAILREIGAGDPDSLRRQTFAPKAAPPRGLPVPRDAPHRPRARCCGTRWSSR